MSDAYTSYFKLDYNNTESYKDLEKFFIDNGFKKLPESCDPRPMYFQKGDLKIIIRWYRNLVTLDIENEKNGDCIEINFDEIRGAWLPVIGCKMYELLYEGARRAELSIEKTGEEKK